MKLYSSGCPKCKILEKKMNDKNISYELIHDFNSDYLLSQGFTSLPVLELDSKELLDFSHANTYINSL